jgi:hypothetical protein
MFAPSKKETRGREKRKNEKRERGVTWEKDKFFENMILFTMHPSWAHSHTSKSHNFVVVQQT